MIAISAMPTPLPTAPAGNLRWLPPLAGATLAGVSSYVSLELAGPLQGVLFSSVLIVVLLVPALTAAQYRPIPALLLSAAVGLAALVGPIFALRAGSLNSRVFLPASAVIVTFAIAASGLTLPFIVFTAGKWRSILASVLVALVAFIVSIWASEKGWLTKPPFAVAVIAATVTAGLLQLAKRHRYIAAFVVSLLLLSWLAWPIVLSPWLAGKERWVDVLSPAHPLLAIDAALTGENAPPWTEHRLMYSRLTVLQQHVMTRPPQDAKAAIALNLALIGLGLMVSAADRAVRSLKDRNCSSGRPPTEGEALNKTDEISPCCHG